jgi:hypothetical protein
MYDLTVFDRTCNHNPEQVLYFMKYTLFVIRIYVLLHYMYMCIFVNFFAGCFRKCFTSSCWFSECNLFVVLILFPHFSTILYLILPPFHLSFVFDWMKQSWLFMLPIVIHFHISNWKIFHPMFTCDKKEQIIVSSNLCIYSKSGSLSSLDYYLLLSKQCSSLCTPSLQRL